MKDDPREGLGMDKFYLDLYFYQPKSGTTIDYFMNLIYLFTWQIKD